MDKFCVFCGKKPKKKNMEHVIPQWLIKLTGNPKRKINLGVDWSKEGYPDRSFPFQAFKLPACTTCNTEHGKLEADAQHITVKILENKPITIHEINIFLGWLDKVRIGLWIAFHYLDKNLFEISPKFHIASRLGTDDRLLFIYKSKTAPKGVNFIGANTPVFQYAPSCFLLRINDYFFFNASFQFLVSRRLGFPFSDRLSYAENGMLSFELQEARKRVMEPIIQWPHDGNCLEIYQPMYGNNGIKEQSEGQYDDDYVIQNSLDFDKNIGKAYWNQGGKVSLFPSITAKDWINLKEIEFKDLSRMISRQTFEFQNKFLDLVSYDDLQKNERSIARQNRKRLKLSNRQYIESTYKLLE